MKKRMLASVSSLVVCGLLVTVISMTAQVHALCRVTCRTSLTEKISPTPPARTVSTSAPYMVSGVLSYSGDSRPISGKTITLTGNSPTITGSTNTGDTGHYIFELTAPSTPGHYKVIVQFAGDPGLGASSSNNILTVVAACSNNC